MEFHLSGGEELGAYLVLDALEVFALFQAAVGGQAMVELFAGELDLQAVVVVLDEADEMAGGEARIVEDFEGALGGEVPGLVVEAGGFLRSGRRRRRGGILVAAPLEDVGTE
jgi:hypothetical protein